MKKLFAAFLLFLSLLAPASSGAVVLDEFRNISIPQVLRDIYTATDTFMEEYYVAKPAAYVAQYLTLLNRGGMLQKYPASEPAVAGFMSVLLTENKNRTLEWLMPGLAPHNPETVDMLQHALWLAGRADEPDLAKLFSRKPDYLKKPAGKLAERKVGDEADIKMLWGAYLASGDVAYAAPVLDACAGGNEKACASLKTFALGHYRVLNAVKDRIDAEKDETKRAHLETARAPRNMKLSHMDGDFGAHLVIADYEVALHLKMTDEGAILKLPVKTKAKPGERAIFLLVFTGMSLDENLAADVSFDLKVVDPKGNTVVGTEMKNQRIVPDKFRTNYGVHHHGSFMGIYFKKRDIPGVYTVTAEVRDNRTGKKIPLSGKIDFKR